MTNPTTDQRVSLPAARWLLIGSIALISVVALALRSWGAGWSLPYVAHPDEPAVMNQVLRMVEGDLSPATFFYPSLVKYCLTAVLHLHFWWGVQTGLYPAALELPRTTDFYTTIPAAYVWGRSFTAVCGAGTVLALAAWGGRFVGWGASLLGAVLLAISVWAIDHSHFIAVDIPAALTGTLALLAALAVLRRGSWSTYLLAGVLIGLAAGTKYQNALVAVAVVLAHGLHWQRAALVQSGRLIVAGLVSIGVFLLTSPYIVLDFATFSRDFGTLLSSYGGEHGDVTGRWPLDAYVEFLWADGLQPLPFLLLLVGIPALVRRDPATAAVLLAFPLALLAILLPLETHFFRNFLPAQPALLLFAGVGAVALWDGIAPRLPGRWRLPVALLAVAVLIGPLLVPAVQRGMAFSRPDARVAAQEWARQEWPGTRIASELSHPLRWDGVAQSTYLHYLPLRPLEWYRQQGYGLLLANSNIRLNWNWTDEYAPLLEAGEVVATFGGPESTTYRGPRIDLIATGLTTTTLPIDDPQATLGPLQLLDVSTGRLVQDTTGPELMPDQPARVGEALGITAFWTTAYPVPSGDYMLFVHLRDADGQNLVQRDAPLWQNLFPPRGWPPGRLVAESLNLPLPATLPPGEYRLVLGLYDGQTQTRFTAMQDGQPLPNNEVDLGMVEVVE